MNTLAGEWIDILSFDCANKSLAYTYLSIFPGRIEKLESLKLELEYLVDLYNREGFSPEWIEKYKVYTEHKFNVGDFIKIHKINVVNLLGDRKVKDVGGIERIKLLKKHLDECGFNSLPKSVKILIEEQPSFNYKSSSVKDILTMYFAEHDVCWSNADSKRQIYFAKGMDYESYIEKAQRRLDEKLEKRLKRVAEITEKNEKRKAKGKPPLSVAAPPLTVGKVDKYRVNKEHSKENFVYFLKLFGLSHHISHIDSEYLDDAADSFNEIFIYLFYKKVGAAKKTSKKAVKKPKQKTK